jgi:hypothetical protein
VDYRKKRTDHAPILIEWGCSGADWERQVHWCPHHQQTNMVQAHHDKAYSPSEDWKYLAWVLRSSKRFYSCTIKSILAGCITAWYGNCSASDHKALQSMWTAQYMTRAKLHAILDLYTRLCQRKALKIVRDTSHPS